MTPQPLLITADPHLHELVLRATAGAAVDLGLAARLSEARRAWAGAPVVLLDAAALDELVASSLPARRDLVVVTAHDAPAGVWRRALEAGADAVLVLPDDERALTARLVPDRSARRAHVVGVVGGSGGAGASVLAVALALSARRRGDTVALVEADPDGAGLDLALAAEEVAGARWPDLEAVAGPVEPDAVRAALPLVDGVLLLAAGRPDDRTRPGPALPMAAVPHVLDALASCTDVVVLDLPRAHGDVLDLLVPRCDVVLLVATPDVRGIASARRVSALLAPRCDLRLVQRDVPGAELGVDDVADWLGLEPAAQLGHDPRLTAALDRGDAPGARGRTALSRACDGLLAAVTGAP